MVGVGRWEVGEMGEMVKAEREGRGKGGIESGTAYCKMEMEQGAFSKRGRGRRKAETDENY